MLLSVGCSANYKVEFTNGEFKEDIYIFTDSKSFVEKTKDKEGQEEIAYQMFLFDEGYNNFERKLEYDKTNAGFNYHTKFALKEKQNWETVAKKCYEEIKVTKDKKYITIETSEEFLCFDTFEELENVSISFKTNYEVIDSNADDINTNRYIWRIKEEEKDYKPIYIKMENKNVDQTEKAKNSIPYFAIILLIILGIAIFLFVKKRKKNNDF